MHKVLQTPRLVIRPIDLGDASFLKNIANSEGWIQYIGDRKIYTDNDAQIYIQKILDKHSFFYNVIELKESKYSIGLVTFLKREYLENWDFGFALLPEFEKQGYAYEASSRYLEELKKDGCHGQVLAITLPENKKSIRLLEKLGFKYALELDREGERLSKFELFFST